jgi:DNA helicase II / ATP-dependent DNA helicase PcrA
MSKPLQSTAALAAQDAPFLAALNAPQRQAVLTTQGPVLMLAGAGTGKTKALTARLAYLIAARLAFPSQILAVTFTNKAAREMQQRIGTLIGQAVEGMRWLGTFHSVAARMLRQHAELVGLTPNFTILDSDDQHRLLKQLIQAVPLDEKRWPARLLAHHIDQWKNQGLRPDQVPQDEAMVFANGKAIALYTAYQARLQSLNACDFGDLLLHLLTLFQKHPDILSQWQQRFRYILVDEYQDTNICQYLWLRLLALGHHNICCVGDDDQSIYGWRGAEVGNILRFEKDFPGATLIRLEQNYRSSGHILGAASGLIAHNHSRLGKQLWTQDPLGEPIRHISVWDGAEEALVVAGLIEQALQSNKPLSQSAILVRAGFQTRAFEERFLTLGMPYRIVGGTRFYERLEIRDALAYLRLIQTNSDDLAFERIINTPKRGLGDKALSTIHRCARMLAISLMQAAQNLIASDELTPAAKRALAGFVHDISRWRALVPTLTPSALAKIVLEESGLIAQYKADKSPEAAGRLDNLQELVQAIEEFETINGFLEHVALVMDNEYADTTEKVTLMTLHAAKGLEFDTVYLAGWEEGIFPSQRALDEKGQAGLEEERRLAYVGLTRARREAVVISAANRLVYGQWQSSLPSRFIEEIPAEHRRHETTRSAPTQRMAAYAAPTPYNPSTTDRQTPSLRRAAVMIEGQARVVPSPPRTSRAFQTGDRVVHAKFGAGDVIAVDGNKLDILFDKHGRKHVIESFVEKEK